MPQAKGSFTPTTPPVRLAPAALRRIANEYDAAASAMEKAIPFIMRHEGYRQQAYWDEVGGKWTVGHGHTHIMDPVTKKMREVRRGDVMDAATSRDLLEKTVRQNAAWMAKNLKWSRKLSPNALAALYDVAYNAGRYMLDDQKGHSPRMNRRMLNILKSGERPDDIVWSELMTYNKARDKTGKLVEVPGLTARRQSAMDLFRHGR